MLNLHLYPSNYKNESRIEKIANSISLLNIFSKIDLVGCGDNELVKVNDIISIRLLGRTNPIGSSLLYKIISFLYWYTAVLKKYSVSELKCVNAHSLSSLVLGVILKKRSSCYLIYDTHELETETHSMRGYRKKIAKLIERKLIKYCDHVFVVSESIANFYCKEYEIQRPTVLLNSPPKIDLIESKDLFRTNLLIPQKNKIFLYQGVLSVGRGIQEILESFTELPSKNINACVVFMGYGPLEDVIKSYAARYSNIYFHEAVSPNVILEYTASADFGFSLINNICLSYYYCMPNKLFEYGMTGLPAIVSNNPDMANYVNLYNTGFVLDKINSKKIIETVVKAVNTDLSVMRANCIKAASLNSWDKQNIKLSVIYREIFEVKDDSNT